MFDVDFIVLLIVIDLDFVEYCMFVCCFVEELIVLLSNDGVLLFDFFGLLCIVVIGFNVDSVEVFMGCYLFVNYVLVYYLEVFVGIVLLSVFEGLCVELLDVEFMIVVGCDVEGEDCSGFLVVVFVVIEVDVVVVVVGDCVGLFGCGMVGEGNDVDFLELFGV